MLADSRRGEPARGPDDGSVAPLVIGMMLCLLILAAGLTAAGSAFLAGQRLQNLCDGAAAAAANSVDVARYASVGGGASLPLDPAVTGADTYLRVRGAGVNATVAVGTTSITVTCRMRAPITFGALFGAPTLDRVVTSTARPAL